MLAMPPYGSWLLAPVAVGRTRLCRGLHGAGVRPVHFFGLLTPWLRVIGPDAWLGVSLFGRLHGDLGVGSRLLLRLPGMAAVGSVLVGCGRGGCGAACPFGGFPWGRLAYSQVTPDDGLGFASAECPWLGFAVVLAGSLLAWLFSGSIRRATGTGRALVLAAGLVRSCSAGW